GRLKTPSNEVENMLVIRIQTLIILATILLWPVAVFAQRPASLRGQVTDQLGAVIIGASITLTDQNGKQFTAQSDDQGSYRFTNLTPGKYDVRVTQTGFASYEQTSVDLQPGPKTLDVKWSIPIEPQRVTIDNQRMLSVDPGSNKGAQVLSGKTLDALSDDPQVLAAQLDALAGPAAGPAGTQVYVDGFTAT